MEFSGPLLAASAGLCGGFIIGLAAREGRFCTLGAIEDTLFGDDTTRWRMWLVAMAVAIAATLALGTLFNIDLGQSAYVTRSFNLPSIIIGGLLFGVGMALVGTCAFGSLVRLGGGDLKSFVVILVLAVSAFMAAAGPTASLRALVLARFDMPPSLLPDTRLDQLVAMATGVSAPLVSLAVAVAILAWVWRCPGFSKRVAPLLWGGVVGLVIALGWVATGWWAADPFDPVATQSFTFVRPIGNSVMYLMTSSGSAVTFGIGTTVGVVLGSFTGAYRRGELRWEASDEPREMRRQIVGAFLMGTGGVYAMGCTIGQGLTAVSVLSISAPIALAMIWLGAWFGLTYLIEGRVPMPFGLRASSRGT